MRNMNSADKVDDDACHKEKSAENNVSHDIAWGICGIHSWWYTIPSKRQHTPFMPAFHY